MRWFLARSDTLKLPKSTVSKAVARLERELDVKLPRPDDAHRRSDRRGPRLLRAVRRARRDPRSRAASDHRSRPRRGRARPTHGAEDYGAQIVSPAIAELVARYPRLSFEVRYTDQVLDLVREGFDLAVRLGKLRASRLYARRLGESTLIAVASPSYIASAPPPTEAVRLERAHVASRSPREAREWTLRSPRELVRLRLEPRVVCNQMTSLIQMATRGAGVALVPSFLCRTETLVGAARSRATRLEPSRHGRVDRRPAADLGLGSAKGRDRPPRRRHWADLSGVRGVPGSTAIRPAVGARPKR